MSKRRVAIVALSALLVACGADVSSPSKFVLTAPDGSAALEVTVRTHPDPPEAGQVSMAIEIRQQDGAPVSDAGVTLTARMPAMPSMNMPAMRSDFVVQSEGNGRYRGTGALEMNGAWNVTLAVSRDGRPAGQANFGILAK